MVTCTRDGREGTIFILTSTFTCNSRAVGYAWQNQHVKNHLLFCFNLTFLSFGGLPQKYVHNNKYCLWLSTRKCEFVVFGCYIPKAAEHLWF